MNMRDNIDEAVIKKLEREENLCEDRVVFWLQHCRLLVKDNLEEKMDYLGIQPDVDTCEFCNAVGIVHDSNEDICQECGIVQKCPRLPILRARVPSGNYNPRTHLHNILHELQCLREVVPDKLIDMMHECVTFIEPTFDNIKLCLRVYGYSQYYSLIPSLQQRFDPNYSQLMLTRTEEEKLKELFFQYMNLSRTLPGRKNRLNYHFVIYKLCIILNYHHVIPYLRLPKGKITMERHERLWNDIVQQMNMYF